MHFEQLSALFEFGCFAGKLDRTEVGRGSWRSRWSLRRRKMILSQQRQSRRCDERTAEPMVKSEWHRGED